MKKVNVTLATLSLWNLVQAVKHQHRKKYQPLMISLFDLLTSPGVMPGLLMQHTMTVLRSLTPDKIEKVKQLLTKHTIRGAAMYGGVSYFTALQIKRGKYEKYKMKENESEKHC